VIGKIGPRRRNVASLIRYLYGAGPDEEHVSPHIVAGWWSPAELEPPLRPNGRRDFRRLTGLLDQPNVALGSWAYEQPVWHCMMRAAPEDRLLSKDEWGQIARDVVHRTGLCPIGEEDDAVRWVAIRRGDDRIHIIATLARQDGGKPRLSFDRYKVRAACRAAEERYDLRRTGSSHGGDVRGPSSAEINRGSAKPAIQAAGPTPASRLQEAPDQGRSS
jgi:hypothetical protein